MKKYILPLIVALASNQSVAADPALGLESLSLKALCTTQDIISKDVMAKAINQDGRYQVSAEDIAGVKSLHLPISAGLKIGSNDDDSLLVTIDDCEKQDPVLNFQPLLKLLVKCDSAEKNDSYEIKFDRFAGFSRLYKNKELITQDLTFTHAGSMLSHHTYEHDKNDDNYANKYVIKIQRPTFLGNGEINATAGYNGSLLVWDTENYMKLIEKVDLKNCAYIK